MPLFDEEKKKNMIKLFIDYLKRKKKKQPLC